MLSSPLRELESREKIVGRSEAERAIAVGENEIYARLYTRETDDCKCRERVREENRFSGEGKGNARFL